MARIGVFVCHCGSNIAATVDVEAVAGAAADFPGVAYATDYKYMCSDPGQDLVVKAIKEKGTGARVLVMPQAVSCVPRVLESEAADR